jgi:hypothetical protein
MEQPPDRLLGPSECGCYKSKSPDERGFENEVLL